ncbi:MAG TPA: DUF362 domain-containing protein [Spirochaetota bacterium]|nr:DUF362 domain-containing protein [Spirochaetota bacterium]HOL57672.1 DUF362 domain-containing protein [Spirochaetota bacterium]HPP05272.1 DUF362 domain-containing protein [Spirochaetota bacterium]
MERREFIKKTLIGAGLLASNLYLPINLFGEKQNEKIDLVAVKNGEPDIMFDEAIKFLGGMSNFVKKNQIVVIKPNIGWNREPEMAANTNPKLVKRIVEHCINAGAKKVYVFDNTCDYWENTYKTSGIEKAVKEAGGIIVSGASESYYQEVIVPKSKVLPKTKVHELIIQADVFINVPILKSHGSTKVTVALKNLMGCVWDRWYYHSNNLSQCIADFPLFRKPDLNIVDCYYVMKSRGPRGVSREDVVILKSLIVSKDIVAADSAAITFLGYKFEDITHIKLANQNCLGESDLTKLNIKRISL